MNKNQNYLEINRQSWNQRTDIHVNSEFYDLENFIKGKSSLNYVEINLLGDISGKSVLHLQCHFGQDSFSLERKGASVTGVDFSDQAIDKAQQLAQQLNSTAKFICCDLYDLPKYLDQKFDIVFTSYGTIGWLPDLEPWAKIIAQFLKPNGQFVLVEFHPVVWMFDNDFEKVAYRYFKSEPIVETEQGTYADKNADLTITSMTWNHSIAEVLNSLIQNGLEINLFNEYDYSPYNCFNKTISCGKNKYRIEHLADKIPMLYALKASKK